MYLFIVSLIVIQEQGFFWFPLHAVCVIFQSSNFLLGPDDAAVLHRTVLFLGKLENKPHWSTWNELHNALSVKHPDVSKSKLRKIVEANTVLFCVSSIGVQLYQLDHEFVREYFELSDDVEVEDHHTDASYSLSSPGHIHIGKTILVTGMVCAASISKQGRSVLFKFGDSTAYRLENRLGGNYNGGQMLQSVLSIRKVVNRSFFLVVMFAKMD